MTQDNTNERIERQEGQDRYGIPITRGCVITTDERGVDSQTLLVSDIRGNAIIGAVISSAEWDGQLEPGVAFDMAPAHMCRVVFNDFREIVAAMDYQNDPAAIAHPHAPPAAPTGRHPSHASQLLSLVEQLANIAAQIGPLAHELAPRPDSDCEAFGEDAIGHIDDAMDDLVKIFPAAAMARACRKHCTPAPATEGGAA